MAEVGFKNVCKIYEGDHRALTNFSLEIADGELLVLVGPSGCGKTTALRLLAGLEEVSQGEICIDGEVVNDQSPQERNIAMVFQNYALYPHMTVRKNLEFPLRMRGLSRKEINREVGRAAQTLGLLELLERRPRQLSGGQRQRVAMGRAIVRQPQVFLMDEPLSNLDAGLRLQIRSEIAALQQSMGITTLYVTHDQVEAMTLGQRVAVMNQGELQQVAAPQALYDDPANTFVADFVGSPGMNLFETALSTDDQGNFGMVIAGVWFRLGSSVRDRYQQLDRYVNSTIIAGLRPEAFSMQRKNPENVCIQATVKSTESLGHEMLVYFSVDHEKWGAAEREGERDRSLVARLSGYRNLSTQAVLPLYVDTDKVYLFDRDGSRIP